MAVEPDTVAVPDLQGLTVSQAQSALSDEGLTLGSQLQEPSSEIPSGQIVRSEPAAGEEVEPGTAVDVVVSTGPEMVEVPDVSSACLSIGAARQALTAVGLVLEEGEPVPSNPEQCPNPSRILAQDPAAGTVVEAGSTVTVFRGGGGDV